jgi:surface antigen
MGQVGHVACMAKVRNANSILVRESEGKEREHLYDLCKVERIIFR